MSDHRRIDRQSRDEDEPKRLGAEPGKGDRQDLNDPLILIDECLASLPDDDPRQALLYKLRHAVLQGSVSQLVQEGLPRIVVG